MSSPLFRRSATFQKIWLTTFSMCLATSLQAQSRPTLSARAVRHQRALNILRGALKDTTKFKRVHAAEALLWNGYPAGVLEAFEQEEKTATPDYIHGVWRTLAQAHGKDSTEWRHYENLVYHRFMTPETNPVGLLETLGKLHFSRPNQKIRRIAAHGDSRAKPMARWVISNSGASRDEAYLAALLDSSSVETRGLAAYAFRFYPRVRKNTLHALHECAMRETAPNSRRVYILSSWFVHAPEPYKRKAKEALLMYADKGVEAERYEVCMALARAGDSSDIPLIERLLSDPEIDVRVSAAHAILSLDRRRARGELK